LNRLISIGLAIAVAPAILIAYGWFTASPETVEVASFVLFNVTLPLAAVLVLLACLIPRPAQRAGEVAPRFSGPAFGRPGNRRRTIRISATTLALVAGAIALAYWASPPSRRLHPVDPVFLDPRKVQEPLAAPDSSLVRVTFEAPVPTDPVHLLEPYALFRFLGFRAEAEAVHRLIERRMLLALLGTPAPGGISLRAALQQAAKDQPPLQDLRSRVLASAIEVRLPVLDAQLIKDLDARPGSRHIGEGILEWKPGAFGHYSIPLAVTSRARMPFIGIEHDVLVPTEAGGLRFSVDRSGGSPTRSGERLIWQADMRATERKPAAEQVIQAVRRARSANAPLANDVKLINFYPDTRGVPRFRLSTNGSSWYDIRDAEEKARVTIMQASCFDLGACVKPRAGVGLSNYRFWIALDLIVASAILVWLLARRRSWPVALFAIYWALSLMAGFLAYVDRPQPETWGGILSYLSGMALAFPWSYILPLSVHNAVAGYFPADAAVVTPWIGIAINQALLAGLMLLIAGRRSGTLTASAPPRGS